MSKKQKPPKKPTPVKKIPVSIPMLKKLLTVRNCLAGGVILITVTTLVIACLQYRLLNRFREEELQRKVQHDERFEELHRDVAVIQESVEELGAEVREGAMVRMMSEKFGYDYTQRALQYFREANYANAAETFNRALGYQRSNTTLQFYYVYSVYLQGRNSRLSASDLTRIRNGLAEIRRGGFREEERLGFSRQEMEEKAAEMEANIDLLLRQGG